MTKEELVKEINSSLRHFLGKTTGKDTLSSIKGVLVSQLQHLADRGELHRPCPIPQCSIEIEDNQSVSITYTHPVTGKLLTQEDMDEWLNGGYL